MALIWEVRSKASSRASFCDNDPNWYGDVQRGECWLVSANTEKEAIAAVQPHFEALKAKYPNAKIIETLMVPIENMVVAFRRAGNLRQASLIENSKHKLVVKLEKVERPDSLAVRQEC